MTRRTSFALIAVAALACVGAALPAAGAESPAAGRYIVVLEDGANSHAVAKDHALRYGASVRFVYGHALKGYAGVIPDGKLDDVRSDSRVAYVERDGSATAVAQTLPWGINKIDADISSTKAGDGGADPTKNAISNVHAYIIDTGIDTAHTDLHVVGHVNFAGGQNRDCNGHGTHVAGTIAANDNTQDAVGAAPGAPLTGVKVLGCGGSGSWSGVIKGVDWVTANAVKPAVANMSLGGGVSKAVDDAVKNSASSGVFYALAAGNEGANACNSSPARAGAGSNNGIATTAATDSRDMEASWSNYGSCVDIWAPGVSVLSTRKGGGTTTMSGTSMASPHTGGGGALYLSSHTSSSPSTVENALKSAATTTSNKSKDGRAITRLYVGGF